MKKTPEINVSELAQRLHRLATDFNRIWPKWMEFVTERQKHGYPLWKYIEGNIWIASHDDIVKYINTRYEQGNPVHPRSFHDESADFAGYRDYARRDARLTEVYKQMNPEYPELEQQIFDALGLARQHGDAAARQHVRRTEEAFSELQNSLNAHLSILHSSYRHPNDVAKDIADCLVLTAKALQDGINQVTMACVEDSRGRYRFDVALSFPGEKRDYVQAVDLELQHFIQANKIFFDQRHEAELARPNLDAHLQQIYHEDAELIIVFLCVDYERKKWCGLEWRAIRDLIADRSASVMPFRFDGVTISGIFSTDGYINAKDKTPEQAARLIHQRLLLNRSKQDDRLGAILTVVNSPTVTTATASTGGHLMIESSATTSLTGEAMTLLVEASNDPRRQIMHIRFDGGEAIQTNNKTLNNPTDPRDCAKWCETLQTLDNKRLIHCEDRDEVCSYYQLTTAGYDVADKIKAKRSPN